MPCERPITMLFRLSIQKPALMENLETTEKRKYVDITYMIAEKTNTKSQSNDDINKQLAEAAFDKISGSRNKTYPGLISMLQRIQKCIA